MNTEGQLPWGEYKVHAKVPRDIFLQGRRGNLMCHLFLKTLSTRLFWFLVVYPQLFKWNIWRWPWEGKQKWSWAIWSIWLETIDTIGEQRAAASWSIKFHFFAEGISYFLVLQFWTKIQSHPKAQKRPTVARLKISKDANHVSRSEFFIHPSDKWQLLCCEIEITYTSWISGC